MTRTGQANSRGWLAALLMMSGCTERICLQPVARDSAGVRIMEHGTELIAAVPVMSLEEPDLRIGEVEGRPEYEFARVTGVVPLPDGGVAVADNGNHLVRFFDGAGEYQRSTGRGGSGPGEFRVLSFLWPTHGDSVLAYDGSLDRFTVLPARGGGVRTFMPAPTDDLRYAPVAVFPDAAILGLTAHGLGGSGNGIMVDSSMLLIHDAAGAFVDSLVPSRWLQRWRRSSGGITTTLSLPFTMAGQYTVAGDRVCLADSDVFEVRCLTRDGRLNLIVRAALPERPVTQAMIDSFMVAQSRRPIDAARRMSVWREIPFPNKLPPYMDLLGTADGEIWVAGYQTNADSIIDWYRFGADGGLKAILRVPATFRLHAALPDHVYGVDVDSLGVQYVTRRRLPRAPQRCSA